MGAAATGQQSGQPESEPTQEVWAGRRGRTVPCWAASSLPRVHSLDSKAPLGPGAIMIPIFPADWSGPRSGAQIQAGVDRGVPRPQPPWSSEYGRVLSLQLCGHQGQADASGKPLHQRTCPSPRPACRLPQMLQLGANWKWNPIWLIKSV